MDRFVRKPSFAVYLRDIRRVFLQETKSWARDNILVPGVFAVLTTVVAFLLLQQRKPDYRDTLTYLLALALGLLAFVKVQLIRAPWKLDQERHAQIELNERQMQKLAGELEEERKRPGPILYVELPQPNPRTVEDGAFRIENRGDEDAHRIEIESLELPTGRVRFDSVGLIRNRNSRHNVEYYEGVFNEGAAGVFAKDFRFAVIQEENVAHFQKSNLWDGDRFAITFMLELTYADSMGKKWFSLIKARYDFAAKAFTTELHEYGRVPASASSVLPTTSAPPAAPH